MTARVWPAKRQDLEAARRFLRTRPRGLTAIAADRDVDGLSAAVLLRRTILRLHGRAAVVVARRGEHVHADAMRARLRAVRPGSLVVVDMGSRAGPILAGVPTLVIDHHQPRGQPAGTVMVSAFGHPPVAPTSLLAYHVVREVVDVEDHGVAGPRARSGTVRPPAGPALPRHVETREARVTLEEDVAMQVAARTSEGEVTSSMREGHE